VPREHAVIRLDMWGDDDWRRLSVPAQHLYMLLLTSPTLSFCGVADWRPTRIARLAGNWAVTDVLKASDELRAGLFLVVDDETEEVLIRSFVRHDGVMKMPNMATAMATSHAAIASPLLRGVVVHELRRLHEKEPELAGWKSKRALAVLDRDAINPSVNPSRNPSVKGSGNPSSGGNPNPSVNPSPTPAPTPSPTPQEETLLSAAADEPDPFVEFWKHYPRKTQKRDAEKAYRRALKRADAGTILAGLRRYQFKDDPQFIPQAERWLNGDRWEDQQQLSIVTPPAGGTWTEEQLTAVLGPDKWRAPQPPPEIPVDEQWDWVRQQLLTHRQDRIRQAIAKQQGGVA
jgi:hypothetical protein